MNASAPTGPLIPYTLQVRSKRQDTHDVVTLTLGSADPLPSFQPGQFNMLYAFGVGEAAISISGDPARDQEVLHTIRSVGPVTASLARMRRGDTVAVRGPFGTPWPMEELVDRDVVLVAGGVGLAPLRPVLYSILNHRQNYRRLSVVYGARSPADLMFQRELARWAKRRDMQFDVIVDHCDAAWSGATGPVTRLLGRLYCRPERSVALLCGPEVMMRFAARELVAQGFSPERMFVSLERGMKCGVGTCGRCQLGPHFICKNGPVFPFRTVQSAMTVREL